MELNRKEAEAAIRALDVVLDWIETNPKDAASRGIGKRVETRIGYVHKTLRKACAEADLRKRKDGAS